MKKCILMTAILLLAMTAMAQKNNDDTVENVTVKDARYCMSYEEFVNNQWQSVEQLKRIIRTENQKFWYGGAPYQFKKDDKAFDKLLKKKAFAIAFDDSIYINFHGLKHKGAPLGLGYDKCYLMGNKIVITDRYVSKKKNMTMGALAGAGGVFAGIIGGTALGIASQEILTKWAKQVCYIIENDTKKITLIDQEMMETLLANHPDLLSQYNQVEGNKEKRSAITVMPLLIKAGIIK